MNLIKLIDPKYGLQEDKWSISNPAFGIEKQVKVVGWSGYSGKSAKFYIVFCDICSKDYELHGEGYFKCVKKLLLTGSLPCGCSKICKWTHDQFEIMCKRKANELGYNFLSFNDNWRGSYTKLNLSCKLHGEWMSTSLASFIHNNTGCPKCKRNRHKLKTDEDSTRKFLLTDCFPDGTIFTRSARTDKKGHNLYFDVYCPVCDEINTSYASNLAKGHLPCHCSVHSQRQAYINFVIDSGVIVALKFGIAVDSKRRARQQNLKSVFEVSSGMIFEFTDKYLCKSAEKVCLYEFECGIINKSSMPDGWSETTWVYNLEKIIKIYELHGGIRIE